MSANEETREGIPSSADASEERVPLDQLFPVQFNREAEKQSIETLLTQDPSRAFSLCQTEFAPKGLGLESALEMCDLLEVPRSNVAMSLCSAFKAEMAQRISTLPEESIKSLLHSLLPFLLVEELRTLPLQALSRCHRLPEDVIRYLHAHYAEVEQFLPVPMRRAVWEHDPSLFRPNMFVALHQLIQSDLPADAEAWILSASKIRANHPQLAALVDMIGDSETLYSILLSFIPRLYRKFFSSQLCFLRLDLPLRFFDLGASRIYEKDPAWNLAREVDLWLQNGQLDEEAIKRFKILLRPKLKKDTLQSMDICMILCSPPVLHLSLENLYKRLENCIDQQILPKNDPVVEFLCRHLYYASRSRAMIRSNSLEFLEIEEEFRLEFLPLIVSMMVEDRIFDAQCRMLLIDMNRNVRRIDPNSIRLSPLDPGIWELVHPHPVASIILLRYGLRIIELEEVDRLEQIIPLLSNLPEETIRFVEFDERSLSLLRSKEWDATALLFLDQYVSPGLSRPHLLELFLSFLCDMAPVYGTAIVEQYLEPCRKHQPLAPEVALERLEQRDAARDVPNPVPRNERLQMLQQHHDAYANLMKLLQTALDSARQKEIEMYGETAAEAGQRAEVAAIDSDELLQ